MNSLFVRLSAMRILLVDIVLPRVASHQETRPPSICFGDTQRPVLCACDCAREVMNGGACAPGLLSKGGMPIDESLTRARLLLDKEDQDDAKPRVLKEKQKDFGLASGMGN